jgi:hypothetical protein
MDWAASARRFVGSARSNGIAVAARQPPTSPVAATHTAPAAAAAAATPPFVVVASTVTPLELTASLGAGMPEAAAPTTTADTIAEMGVTSSLAAAGAEPAPSDDSDGNDEVVALLRAAVPAASASVLSKYEGALRAQGFETLDDLRFMDTASLGACIPLPAHRNRVAAAIAMATGGRTPIAGITYSAPTAALGSYASATREGAAPVTVVAAAAASDPAAAPEAADEFDAAENAQAAAEMTAVSAATRRVS